MVVSPVACSSPLTEVRLHLVLGSDYTRFNVELGSLTRQGFHIERRGTIRLPSAPLSLASNDLGVMLYSIADMTRMASITASGVMLRDRR
jgi:hypothetical protein